MVYKLSDNIISSLGFSSLENYRAVKEGKSGLQLYENKFNIPSRFVASLVNTEKVNDLFAPLASNTSTHYTHLEKLAILSIKDALSTTNVNPADDSVLFILSTTKGNVELLEENTIYEKNQLYLWRSAELIAQFFGNKNQSLVVSNACISGVSAQLAAQRHLQAKRYKYVIVVGAEVLSKFIISGFQSFKALSVEKCKPFDKDRTGLNVGEAAATVIYTSAGSDEIPHNAIILECGTICNDANHISGPSRTGEGLFNAITKSMQHCDRDDLSFINAHGTATPFNDDMESVAIKRSRLDDVPTNSLKAYFGHTLGAAGIVETIISSYALQDNLILASLGFDRLGVVEPIHINTATTLSTGNRFLKLISGFGGCNAAAIFRKNNI